MFRLHLCTLATSALLCFACSNETDMRGGSQPMRERQLDAVPEAEQAAAQTPASVPTQDEQQPVVQPNANQVVADSDTTQTTDDLANAQTQGGTAQTVPLEEISATESFNMATQRSAAPIDIIWTLDNSESMSKEAQLVRDNLSRFATYLGKETNARLLLLSRKGTDETAAALTAQDEAQGHVQADIKIKSTNGLAIAAAASCPAASTKLSGTNPKICGLAPEPQLDSTNVGQSAGVLQAYLRPDARRVYVFVTDDNTKGVTENNFLNMLKAAAPSLGKPVVFGFIGPNKTECRTLANPGLSYIALAAATGGKTYNLCATDWSSHFDDLTEKITIISSMTFKLASAPLPSSVKVYVDNEELTAAAWQLSDKTLSINPNAIADPASAKVVKIMFRYYK